MSLSRTVKATIRETITVEKEVVFQCKRREDPELKARHIAMQKMAVNESQSGWEVVDSQGVQVAINFDADEEE